MRKYCHNKRELDVVLFWRIPTFSEMSPESVRFWWFCKVDPIWTGYAKFGYEKCITVSVKEFVWLRSKMFACLLSWLFHNSKSILIDPNLNNWFWLKISFKKSIIWKSVLSDWINFYRFFSNFLPFNSFSYVAFISTFSKNFLPIFRLS